MLRLIAFIDVAVFFGFGVVFLLVPETLLGVLDIELRSAAAYTEVRAMYGGLQIALAIYLAGHYFGRLTQRHVFALSALALGGLASIRLFGMLASEAHPVLMQLLAAEVVGVAVNLAALFATRRIE